MGRVGKGLRHGRKTCVLLLVQQIMAFLMHRVEMTAKGVRWTVYASISIVGINDISRTLTMFLLEGVAVNCSCRRLSTEEEDAAPSTRSAMG